MKRFLRAMLPFLAVGLGVVILIILVKTRPAPAKKTIENKGALVETIVVEKIDKQLVVEAQGSVVPSQKVVLQPEVTGRVVWQSGELVPGGQFKKGDTIVKIDASDYVLQAEQQAANVDRAALELRVEKSRGVIAEDEWRIISEGQRATDEGRLLALRKPQLDTAKTNLDAAKSARARANLAVSKTVIKAPFNGFVQQESVDEGQLVGPQTPLATLVGTDAFWIQVSVPVKKLGAIAVPGYNASAGEGSAATIRQDVGGERVEREGRVIRLLGDLDPVGRMARVLVAIDDPLGMASKKSEGEGEGKKELPLLVGAYVDVAVDGRHVQGVFEIPRRALRDGNRVYVYGAENKLAIREVDVIWRQPDSVLVRRGLTDGDEIVTSRLPSPVPDMLLRKAQLAQPPVGQR